MATHSRGTVLTVEGDVRALDQGGRFTSYFLEQPDDTLDGEFVDEIDSNVEVLWFEGRRIAVYRRSSCAAGSSYGQPPRPDIPPAA